MSKDVKGKDIPDAPPVGSERVELRDDSGNIVGIADVGVGDPTSPVHGQLLSVEDEKRLDADGKEVVRGKLWSESHTGLFLTIALGEGPMVALAPQRSGTSFSVPAGIVHGADYRLFVGVFDNKPPTWGKPVVGAAIELPDDLGQDEIKRKYLTEWIAHTTVECFENRGIRFQMNHEKLGVAFTKMAAMVCMAAEDSIRDTGL